MVHSWLGYWHPNGERYEPLDNKGEVVGILWYYELHLFWDARLPCRLGILPDLLHPKGFGSVVRGYFIPNDLVNIVEEKRF